MPHGIIWIHKQIYIMIKRKIEIFLSTYYLYSRNLNPSILFSYINYIHLRVRLVTLILPLDVERLTLSLRFKFDHLLFFLDLLFYIIYQAPWSYLSINISTSFTSKQRQQKFDIIYNMLLLYRALDFLVLFGLPLEMIFLIQ